MHISVIGGGAVGSYIAGLLTRHADEAQLLARGDHLDAIRRQGLSISTPTESFNVPVDATDEPDALIGSEYALLTVKGYHLAEIAPLVRRLATHGAAIVPLLNGVDIADRLVRSGVPHEQIIEGLITVSVVRTAPGTIEVRTPFQRVVLGEQSGELSPRARSLATTLDRAGVEARVSAEIQLELWRKFAFLTSMAAACALCRGPIGVVLATTDGRELLHHALSEVIAVGRASGIAWAADDESKTRAALESLPSNMKPSFLVDIENGRPTEIDTLSGTVVRLGRAHGVATPVHARVVHELDGSSDHFLRT